ncbi:MAG: isoprenylcysteine carboxylmethyltransferase family protein [Brachymonas sp.]|nr:isoprenylcysteine carboxylmethyltransferase family protein [Brachymonas sp.]MDO4794719.1 isoprenylcysteine carboxylmethyltransferase family protein [Brachymonas sp.]
MRLKVPPVLLLVLLAALMWAMAAVVPVGALPASAGLAVLLAVAGAAAMAAGAWAFVRVQTTLDPRAPEQSHCIVSDGIYRFSRNPMYLGMALILAAWAVCLAHAAAWVGVAGFVLYLNRFQIVPEERALEQKFGEAYRRYCRTTRRWL